MLKWCSEIDHGHFIPRPTELIAHITLPFYALQPTRMNGLSYTLTYDKQRDKTEVNEVTAGVRLLAKENFFFRPRCQVSCG